MMNLPENPILLRSVVNTWLRDKYEDLDDLCYDNDVNKDELIAKLTDAGYKYIKSVKQFR